MTTYFKGIIAYLLYGWRLSRALKGKNKTKILNLLERYVASVPASTKSLTVSAMILAYHGNPEKAKRNIEAAFKFAETEPLPYRTRASMYVYRGFINQLLYYLNEALADYNHAITINAANHEAYLQRAAWYYEQRKYTQQMRTVIML